MNLTVSAADWNASKEKIRELKLQLEQAQNSLKRYEVTEMSLYYAHLFIKSIKLTPDYDRFLQTWVYSGLPNPLEHDTYLGIMEALEVIKG